MYIDWAHFTPISAIAGGAMIGAAAAALILGAGRVLGAAGIFAGALDARGSESVWRWWLLAGLVLAPLLLRGATSAGVPTILAPAPLLIVSGLCVGFGSRLGSGCTSGHGVCGIARLSPRSFAATIVFMASGFAATFALRHLW